MAKLRWVPITNAGKNCGTGSGGFTGGNSCARRGSGGDTGDRPLGTRRAKALAAAFTDIHNSAFKEYQAAFKEVGADLWRDDHARPLKKKHTEFVAERMAEFTRSQIGKIYRVTRPLTVMDKYPDARLRMGELDRAVSKIKKKYDSMWAEHLNNA